MTRENPITRAQGIIKVLRNHPDGASLEQISSELQPPPSNRRALQRWLLELIEQGRVVRTGKARASRYTLPTNPAAQRDHWVYASDAEYVIPARVSRPREECHLIATRGPILHLRNLLEAYHPNSSFHLDESLRSGLLCAGALPATSQRSNRSLIDLAWNSSRLEGNSYPLPEAEVLLSTGRWSREGSTWEAQMLLNHKEAIEFLIEPEYREPEFRPQFDAYTLLNLHALLADNLISSGTQESSEHLEQFMIKAAQIADPFEQSFFAWLHLTHMQPFEGFNEPTARLAANIPLIQNNLCPLLFVDVPQNFYAQTIHGVYEPYQLESLRELYVWAYKRSCKRTSSTRNATWQPDPIKIQYKQEISDAVSHVVRGKMSTTEAVIFIDKCAIEGASNKDRARFIGLVHDQLIGLREGNIARFKLKPSEFNAWCGFRRKV